MDQGNGSEQRKRKHSDGEAEETEAEAKRVKICFLRIIPPFLMTKALGFLGILDQLKLQRVSTLFRRLMPFSTVNLDEVRNMMMEKGLITNGTERKMERVLFFCSTHFPTNRTVTVRSDHPNGRLSMNRWRHMGLTFPNCTTLIVPQYHFVMDTLDHFGNLRRLQVAVLMMKQDFLRARSRDVLQRWTSLTTNGYTCMTTLRIMMSPSGSITPAVRDLALEPIQPVSMADLPMMAQSFPNLAALNIRHAEEEMDLRSFGVFRRLTTLTLRFMPLSYSNSLLNNIGSLSSGLEKLCVSNCYQLRYFGFLAGLRNLRKLNLNSTPVCVAELRHLHPEAPLNRLDVSYSDATCDDLLRLLAERKYPIVQLHVKCGDGATYSSRFSDAALRSYIEGSNRLERLDVTSHASVTSEVCYAEAAFLRRMRHLNVCNTAVDELGIDFLNTQRKEIQARSHQKLPNLTVKTTAPFSKPSCSSGMLENMRSNGLIVQILTQDDVNAEKEQELELSWVED